MIPPTSPGIFIAICCCFVTTAAAQSQSLSIEARIPLGSVRGRIDHLALDVSRQRLYVAERGNDSLGVVDLRTRQTLTSILNLHEPQGVGYVQSTDTVWVTNGGDGTVRIFRGDDGRPAGIIQLGDDADNLRIDEITNRVYVGYGNGHIAVFDAISRKRIADIALQGHPEGFQLDPSSDRLYANVPGARQIAVVMLGAERQSDAWATMEPYAGNFPLALAHDNQRIIVGYRKPSTLVIYDTKTGGQLSQLPICGDIDDIAWDAKRRLAYVSCGEGFIDIVDLADDRAQRVGRIATVQGARTLLYSPDLDRVYVAIRATGSEPASIWVLRPDP